MTDPPMYKVANAVFCRSLAIVRSLPLPGCVQELPELGRVCSVCKSVKRCFYEVNNLEKQILQE